MFLYLPCNNSQRVFHQPDKTWSKDPQSKLHGIETGCPSAGVADPGPASPRPATTQAEASFGELDPKRLKRGDREATRRTLDFALRDLRVLAFKKIRPTTKNLSEF
jgi:hypothetical protein